MLDTQPSTDCSNGHRHSAPAFSERPYGAYKYEVYSPKIGRKVTLHGHIAYAYWAELEAAPHVLGFCERPLADTTLSPPRIIDFWVLERSRESYRILLRPDEKRRISVGETPFSAFVAWARNRHVEVEVEESLMQPHLSVRVRNIVTMVGYIVWRLTPLTEEQQWSLLRDARLGHPIGVLEKSLSDIDTARVRAALFRAVFDGVIVIPDIGERLIDLTTSFTPP